MCNVCLFCYALCAGQQEYSSREAGITTGIVLACLVPILLIIVCVGYRLLKGRKEQREQDEILTRYQIFLRRNIDFMLDCAHNYITYMRNSILEHGKRNCNDCERSRTTSLRPTRVKSRKSISLRLYRL